MLNSLNTLQAVNYLMAVCRKRQEGYTKAAELIKNSDIEKLFVSYAKQSDDFEYELLKFSDREDVSENGDSDDLYQPKGWKYFDDDLDEFSAGNIVAVCEKEEKATIGHYENVLDEEDLPEEMVEVINRHLIGITDAYDTLTEMKKRINGGA